MAMRTKNFLLILCCVILTSLIFIILGPAGQQNDSLKNIVTQTHQQLKVFQENLRATDKKKLDVDPKYLAMLGFSSSSSSSSSSLLSSSTISSSSSSSSSILASSYLSSSLSLSSSSSSSFSTTYNGTRSNFSIVTYVHDGQIPSAILLSQNIATKFPNEYLIIYDLGLSDNDLRILSNYCNNTKCSVISYDLSIYPSHVTDQRMHAYRPIVIKDALIRSKTILFTENYIRIRGNSHNLYELKLKSLKSGILGWTTRKAVSTRTHPKMFDYFETDSNDFLFLPMVGLDAIFITDTQLINEKILLPWIKCTLTLECIRPIGAQSGGCKYNKKPQYRYSGCHAYDTSAFNIVLGLTWHLDESKYSLPGDSNNLFYQETLEQATKILESKRCNSSSSSSSSETSEHPFTDE